MGVAGEERHRSGSAFGQGRRLRESASGHLAEKGVGEGMRSTAQSLSLYFERRMARILLLGIVSGFPWVLIGSALSLWLKEEGLSRTAIGWAGLIVGVYAVNFLWAPLIDRLRVPWLTARLGHRRAWIVTLQGVILACLVLWSAIDPAANLAGVVAVGLVIAIASATQDIAIDALRIEQIGSAEGESMAAGAAVAVVGWWTGYKLGGALALEAAQAFQDAGVEDYWQAAFLVLGVVVVLCNIGLLFVREPPPAERIAAQARDEGLLASRLDRSGGPGRAAAWLAGTVAGPLMSFFRRNGFAIAAAVLGFIFLFKIGEAFLGRMSLVFYRETGFSKTDIALYSKGLGWVTTVAFTVLGGLFAIRMGLVRAMFVAGIAMALTNLLFALLAWTGKSRGAVRGGGGGGRPHQRVRDRDLRRLHLDAGGPDLHRDAVRAARLHRDGGEDPVRRLVRRSGGLAGGRLGHVLRDHHADGGPVAGVPVGHPRKAPRPAGRGAGAAAREGDGGRGRGSGAEAGGLHCGRLRNVRYANRGVCGAQRTGQRIEIVRFAARHSGIPLASKRPGQRRVRIYTVRRLFGKVRRFGRARNVWSSRPRAVAPTPLLSGSVSGLAAGP